jgi:hypothetical protein
VCETNTVLQGQFHQFVSNCENMDISELHGQAPGARGGPPLSNRDLLKAKLQKEKFMTKPLSEIVGSEAEVRSATRHHQHLHCCSLRLHSLCCMIAAQG